MRLYVKAPKRLIGKMAGCKQPSAPTSSDQQSGLYDHWLSKPVSKALWDEVQAVDTAELLESVYGLHRRGSSAAVGSTYTPTPRDSIFGGLLLAAAETPTGGQWQAGGV